MKFSDTTNKDGIIQTIEFLCGMPDAYVSGNSTLLKQITGRINRAFDTVLPVILSKSDHLRFDDTNHTDLPIGTTNLVSGQNDYTITTDENSLSILNITDILILPTSTATDYEALTRVTIDDPFATFMLSPNPTQTGVPSKFLEKDNTIFFDVKPNYSSTNGIKVIFERDPSYFISSDTTKEPGIPKPFHELLALIPAHDWLLIYKPDETALITRIEARIAQMKKDLKSSINHRNPTRKRLIASQVCAE